MIHDYFVFGLVVRSELPLKELPPAPPGAKPDVEIRFGSAGEAEGAPGYSTAGNATLLTIPKVGRYLIRDGREILIEPAEGASERNIRLFLLGSSFGALLHQRGLLPLHANAIVIGDRAVAFSGHSGAGKSTIAAWFHDRGHRILADDVCVIGFDPEGRALAFPGIPRLRLWREALEATGRAADAFDRSFDDMDKYDVPTGVAGTTPQPVELAAVYLLEKSGPENGSGPAAVTSLTGIEAVNMLVSNTYRGGYLKTIGQTGPHLATCVNVARSVPVFSAARHWGFERFDEAAAALEAHARALAGATAAA